MEQQAIYKNELYKEIETLSTENIKEVINFIKYTKIKNSIDPDQYYFLTKEWRKKEMRVEKDKKQNLTIGDGTPKGLIEALKK